MAIRKIKVKARIGGYKHATPEEAHEAAKASKRKYWRKNFGTNAPNDKRIAAVEKLVTEQAGKLEALEGIVQKIKWKLFEDNI